MRDLVPVPVSSALRPVESKANRNKNKGLSNRKQLYSDALFARFKESVIHGEFMTPNQHRSDETFRSHVRDYMSMFYFAGTDRYEFDYSEVKMLGRGGYGAVYKAKNKWDNGYYAIKKIVYNRHVKIRRVLDISLFYDDFVRKNKSGGFRTGKVEPWIQFLPSTGETSSSASESTSTMLTRSTTMPTITTDESYSDDNSQSLSVDFMSSINGSSVAKLSSAVTDSGSFQPWSVGKGVTSLSHTPSSDGITFGCDSGAMTSLPVDSKTHYSSPTSSSVVPLSSDAASIEPLTEAFGDLTILRDYIDARNKALTAVSEPATVLSRVDVEANKYLFRGILEGVHYIHLQGHIHRDLKPHNIFLGMADWKDEGKGIKDWKSSKNQTDWWTDVRKLVAKVGDFGLVTDQFGKDVEAEPPATSQVGLVSLSSGRTAHVGTVAYAAPEQLSQAPSRYNETVDIYPLGIILFELYHPFGTAMERAKILNHLREGKLSHEFVARWPDESALIQRMMSSDPTQRPSAQDILNSPIFAVASPPNSPSNEDAQTANSADSEIMKLKMALEAKEREVEELRRLVSELGAKACIKL
ncbi:kinase-like domain-containing protein [Endogone sp. FLAS-F59071]|nr:kinase-like domain-containing protein [Endogone sp. FLAS-F59071]|eukprot:RUS19490.1 kinase-like domain-containing protein [Endogone sp. FLAS-F59071]